MKKTALLIAICLLLLVSAFKPICAEETGKRTRSLYEYFEKSDRKYVKRQIKNRVVYFHQRMLDGAVVEKNHIRYLLEDRTGQVLDGGMRWRNDLPERLHVKMSREQAEAMVEGEVRFSKLYIISPDSDIFPFDPTPANPCWVVASSHQGKLLLNVIDAVSGKFLGYGISPPQAVTGFSFTGPQYWNPCNSDWKRWYESAAAAFEAMGYPTEKMRWPMEDAVRRHLQSNDTAVLYEIAHGDSTHFKSGCIGGTSADITSAQDVSALIADYPKMPFAFLATCEGMCRSDTGTLSHAFRKGSNEGATTVGYCQMQSNNCFSCWEYSKVWQAAFFDYLKAGLAVKDAYDNIMLDYPQCAPAAGACPTCIPAEAGPCFRFAGDENLALVPVISRDGMQAEPPPLACLGDLNGDGWVDLLDYGIFRANYGMTGSNPADLNGDGFVDMLDYGIFRSHYGSACP